MLINIFHWHYNNYSIELITFKLNVLIFKSPSKCKEKEYVYVHFCGGEFNVYKCEYLLYKYENF